MLLHFHTSCYTNLWQCRNRSKRGGAHNSAQIISVRCHSYNFRFQLPRQRIVSVHNNAACCNSHVQENMLSSNRFTSIQAKPHFGIQNLGCHCKFLGCHFDTQKRLKKNTGRMNSYLVLYQMAMLLNHNWSATPNRAGTT